MAITKFEKLQNDLIDVKRKLKYLGCFVDGVLLEQRKQPNFSEEFSVTVEIKKEIELILEIIDDNDLEKSVSVNSGKSLENILTVRTFNILIENDIKTLHHLLDFSSVDLLKLPRFGRNSLTEIQYYLSDIGLSLKGSNNAD